MKFKINKVYYNTAGKDGKAYVNKNGEKFAIANILVDKDLIDDPDFDGRISFYDGDGEAINWADGMELEGTIEKNEKGYFNFKKANRLSLLEERVDKLEKYCFGDPKDRKESKIDEPKKTKEVTTDDLPF